MTWYQSLAVAICGGIVASYVTMWLSLKRFYKERWWQRRFDGCAAVIEAIHDLQRFTDIQYNEAFDDRKYDEEWRKLASARSDEATRLLRRYADLGELALPPKVAQLLSEYYTDLDRERYMDPPTSLEEMVDDDQRRESKLLDQVVPEAMAGLGLARWQIIDRLLYR